MDIISHGLWGSAAFGRKSKKSFWTAFAFGIMPDFLAFGPFFAMMILGLAKRPQFSQNNHDPSQIPAYISQIYNVTHSLIVFIIVFSVIWFILKKPVLEMLAWGLHILFDIPLHSYEFFPTPFLWPISKFEVNGYPWDSFYIFIPNIIFLILIYLWFFVIKPRRQKAKNNMN